MAQKIKINIDHAKIESFSVDLPEDRTPEVSATIGLFAGSKKISSFTISTKEYFSKFKFDFPPHMIDPILSLAGQLEVITILQCKRALAELPAPEV